MTTTSLYVELVIIGMQTITWLALALDCVQPGIIATCLDSKNTVVIAVLLLGTAYIVGIIFDRLANAVYQKVDDKIRVKSGLQAKSSLLLNETEKMQEHQSYTRSKYRILRSSSLNLPLIFISAVLNIFTNYTGKTYLAIAVLIIGGFFTLLSYWATICTIKDFYKKARIIELYSNKVKH